MTQIEELTDIFKALSDPTRLKLVRLLYECSQKTAPEKCIPDKCEGGPLCVNALASELGLTQSAISQHLRILRQAGLVRKERRGYFVHYTIDDKDMIKIKNLIDKVFFTK